MKVVILKRKCKGRAPICIGAFLKKKGITFDYGGHMLTDVQIAQQTKKKPIQEIAALLGLGADEIEVYGNDKAKIRLEAFSDRQDREDGKLILVTAINPTPAGEGKTTMNVGLSMGLNRIGKTAISALREPSLGPSFGMKGGAAGGGYSQVVPMEDINMHFTGDMHAITSANNLISAMIDNHIHHGNELRIDARRLEFHRVVDLNDRALRKIVVGLGGTANGFSREDQFDITVASELMAILCLSKDLADLKERVGNILIGYDVDREPVYAKSLHCEGAVALLMKDAIKPNLVQTTDNTPAIIHGGPFANIAHGCNSLTATKVSLKLADYVVTEAGFGADLGAEKFFDIKCRIGDLKPAASVLVATIRALKYHGGVKKEELTLENVEAVEAGLPNLLRHVENLARFGAPVVVGLNRFQQDTEAEIAVVANALEEMGVRFVEADPWGSGSKGTEELAKAVVQVTQDLTANTPHFVYEDGATPKQKIEKVAAEIYRANEVVFSAEAKRTLRSIKSLGLNHLPVCMAKTQYSFSDDPKLLGAPEGFPIHVQEIRIKSGAGFLVALTGDIMTMPGLPKKPSAESIDVLDDGSVVGLF